MKKNKFGIKEIWLLDEKGNKVMKLTGCHFDTPENKHEVVYENGVTIVKLKDDQNIDPYISTNGELEGEGEE